MAVEDFLEGERGFSVLALGERVEALGEREEDLGEIGVVIVLARVVSGEVSPAVVMVRIVAFPARRRLAKRSARSNSAASPLSMRSCMLKIHSSATSSNQEGPMGFKP